MNIVIVGAGSDPKRFGTNFVNNAKSNGHSVTTFSYRLNTSSVREIEKRFEDTLSDLEHIDLFVYNSIGGFYPGEEESYHTGHQVNYDRWQEGILINAALPHMMSLKCLEKMNDTSSIVFLTSSASYIIDRDNYFHLAGYFGTKGAMNQLMLALSKHNDKGAICSCLAPHIPYDDPIMAEKIMNKLYDIATTLTKKDNGKVIQCYPPIGNPHYYVGKE